MSLALNHILYFHRLRVICEKCLNVFGNALPLFKLTMMLSLDAVCTNCHLFLSSPVFDAFLCLLSKNMKSWCKRPVSVHCRCACAGSLVRGVLPRQRRELSWHNFHHCIRKEMSGLELHVPTQTWKNTGQIPKCVCLSQLFLLYL